jgi:hypothetical protein
MCIMKMLDLIGKRNITNKNESRKVYNSCDIILEKYIDKQLILLQLRELYDRT